MQLNQPTHAIFCPTSNDHLFNVNVNNKFYSLAIKILYIIASRVFSKTQFRQNKTHIGKLHELTKLKKNIIQKRYYVYQVLIKQ